MDLKEIKSYPIPEFNIGELVYLKTDNEQLERMVTGYKVRLTGIVYLLSCGASETDHYDIEISTKLDQNKKLNY